MKKLFYSFFVLLIIGLTFGSCEKPTNDDDNKDKVENTDENQNDNQKPGDDNNQTGDENQNDNQKPGDDNNGNNNQVEAEYDLYSADFMIDETGGAMYVFEFLSNTLDITTFSGSGDDIIIMMYAQPQTDGFPTAKTYEYMDFEDLTDEYVDCVLGAYPISQDQIIGTFAYVIEDGQATDILLCVGGDIKFEGNAKNGKMTADLEFTSVVTNELVTRQLVKEGVFNLQKSGDYAPRKIKLNK